MGKVSIVRSDGWKTSVYSSLMSDFTTGVTLISTGSEATFTTGASATTIMIASNRNAPSIWPSGRSGRPPAIGVQGHVNANPIAATPASGSLEVADTDVQDPSGPVEAAAPVVDQPKPTTQPDKIELTIDSLQNYDVLKPIRVVVESLGDKVFVAEAPDLNVSTTGNSVGGALVLLKEHISNIYEGYNSRKNLDGERTRQFKVFEAYIGRPRRNWN
jgi:hypothetical protein